MAKVLKTDALISTSLRRAMIPSDQSTFTCCDITDIMNEEMGIHIVPLVLRAHEEYYVIDEDVCLVACQVEYKIPYRAIGNKLRDVSYVNSSNITQEMTRLSIEDRAAFDNGCYCVTNIAYYVENDNIVLLDELPATGKLRMSYYIRPNSVVKNERGAIINTITCCSCAGTTTFTLDTFPTHFTCALCYDFVQGKSPNKILAFDKSPSAVCSSSKTITFTKTDLTKVNLINSCVKYVTFAVGDIITQAEETIIPQLPTELQPILPQRVAVKMLEALGDTEGMQNAQKELERMEYNSMTLIDNRIEGSPKKVVSRNSPLRNIMSSRKFVKR